MRELFVRYPFWIFNTDEYETVTGVDFRELKSKLFMKA